MENRGDGRVVGWEGLPRARRAAVAIDWLRAEGLLTLDEALRATARLERSGRPRLPSSFDPGRVVRPMVLRDGEAPTPEDPFVPLRDASIRPTVPLRKKARKVARAWLSQHRAAVAATASAPPVGGIKAPWED